MCFIPPVHVGPCLSAVGALVDPCCFPPLTRIQLDHDSRGDRVVYECMRLPVGGRAYLVLKSRAICTLLISVSSPPGPIYVILFAIHYCSSLRAWISRQLLFYRQSGESGQHGSQNIPLADMAE